MLDICITIKQYSFDTRKCAWRLAKKTFCKNEGEQQKNLIKTKASNKKDLALYEQDPFAAFFALVFLFFQQLHLEIVQFLAQIHLVDVGFGDALVLLPHIVQALLVIGGDLL